METEATQKNQGVREYAIDASGKRLGRIATEAATVLLGKNESNFKRNQVAPVKVIITNAAQIDLPASKREAKEYFRYTGYPGGQKRESAKAVIAKKGYGELIRKAVNGMLPKNKLRTRRLARLVISE